MAYPQDLIDAVRDGMHARDWQHYFDGDAIAVLDIIRDYDAAHSTPAPDLIDAVKIAVADALSSDYQMLESQAVDVSVAAISAVRAWDAQHPAPDVSDEALDREKLGRIVREVWVRYAIEHGDTKPGHLAPWEELSEYDREVDRQIGETVALASGGGAAVDVPDERAFVEELKSCFGQNMFAGGYSDGAYVPGARIASLIECAYEDILEERAIANAVADDQPEDGGQ